MLFLTRQETRYQNAINLAIMPISNDNSAPRLPSESGPLAAMPDDMEINSNETELVQRIAGSLVRHLPSHIERDELIALGYLGMVEAQRRFDPARGVPFSSFAAGRIRGAMLDWLRQLDPVSRDERSRLRSSDAQASVTLVDMTHADERPAPGRGADEELERSELKAQLWRALGKLTKRERFVVQRHFFEEQSLRCVGAELGVGESRICQIVSAVVARLRTLVGDGQSTFAEAA